MLGLETIGQTFFRLCGRFGKDDKGQVAVIFAVACVTVVGGVGAAIDYSAANQVKTRLKAALDSAVLAGIVDATASRDTTASNMFSANGAYYAGVTVGAPAFVAKTNTSYSGSVTAAVPTKFSGIFGINTINVSASSTASLGVSVSPTPACIIALDSSSKPDVTGIIGAGKGALNASGGGAISANSCNIYVNSSNKESINVTGGGTISADYITTVGDYTGSVIATKMPSQQPTTYATTATIDPYATTRTIPAWGSCSNNTSWSGSIANPAGVLAFCSAVTVSADTTLAPGVYVILDGGLTSTKSITGNGVTIILSSASPASDNGVFDFKSGATISLTAPKTGPTAGIALWTDARLPHNADNFRAGSTANIQGAIYLPSHLVNFSGSAQTGTNCTQLIAAQIAISGAGNFYHNCSGVGILDPGQTTTSAYLSQ